MAQIKISELELNTQMSNEDVLAGVDTSEQKTKKFKLETLKTFINKEQDEQITKNKNDISTNATNIETNAENISKNSENIEKNTQDIIENKGNITDNSLRVKRITNDLYDSGEASGSSINIKDSTLAEFQEITIDGVCKQETTQGINLVNILNTVPYATENGLTTTKNNDGTLSVKGINKKGWDYTISEPINFEAGKTYSLSLPIFKDKISSLDIIFYFRFSEANGGVKSYNSKYAQTGQPVILTINETETVPLKFGLGADKEVDFTVGVQVQDGNITEIPVFEKFTGNQPSPSPSYPQPIEVIDKGFDVVSCSAQLLELENKTTTGQGITTIVEDGTINATGEALYQWANLTSRETTKTTLKKGETYTIVLNQPAPYNFYTRVYGKSNEFDLVIPKNKNYKTFTQPTDYRGIYFFISELTPGMEIDIKDLKVMIYKGEYDETKNSFEPYQETRTPINLPDGEFVGKLSDTIKDQVRLAFNEEDGEYQNNLYKVLARDVLNGSEDGWEYVEQYNYFRCPSYVFSETPTGNMSERMCSHFKVIANWAEFRDDSSLNGICITKDGYKICIRNTNCSTVEEFKQALSESPVTIIYKLAEPYEVDLGVVDMPLSYSPETNVFTTSELEAIINAKYYRNFINTIQNLQVNEKALKEELVDINSRLSALETNLVNMASVQEVESEVVE